MRNQYVTGYIFKGIIDSILWRFAILHAYASSMLWQYIHVTLITWGNVRAYYSWCSKSTKFCNLGTMAIYTMVRDRIGYTKAIYLVLATRSHYRNIDVWLTLRWYSDQDRIQTLRTHPQLWVTTTDKIQLQEVGSLIFKYSRYKNYPDGEIYKSNIAKSEMHEGFLTLKHPKSQGKG